MWTEHFDEKHKQGLEPLSDGTKVTKYYYYTNERECVDGGYDYDVHEFAPGTTNKSAKLAIIDEYDTSEKVNGFSINGISGWIDRDTRTSLVNTVSVEKASGKLVTTLWFGEHSLTLPCDAVLQMLGALEMYAHECYNVTARHKYNVSHLTDATEISEYDYTKDYPAKLNF